MRDEGRPPSTIAVSNLAFFDGLIAPHVSRVLPRDSAPVGAFFTCIEKDTRSGLYALYLTGIESTVEKGTWGMTSGCTLRVSL